MLMPIVNPYHLSADNDPYFSDVVLLLHMNGTDGSTTFTDSSNSGNSFTAIGNAQIDTSISKYGGASGLFDGAGDYLRCANNTDFQLGGGPWTLEFWMYSTNLTGTHQIFNTQAAGTNQRSYAVYSNGNFVRFSISSAGTAWDIADGAIAGAVTINTWHHVAITWDGSAYKGFIDGVLGNTVTSSTGAYAHSGGFLRVASLSINYYQGHLDDFRITKGVARYTANFTPPTAEFPDS